MTTMAATTTENRTEIDARRTEIARLCAKFGVRRLELFGSAARGAFDPACSDLDFLVEFDAAGAMTPFEQYFGLKETLEQLFGRTVDLVMDGATRNPYFLRSLNESRRLLYAA